MNVEKLDSTGNQIVVRFPGKQGYYAVLFSYTHPIVLLRWGNKPVTLLDKKYWNYSNTTSKYRVKFMNENTAETKKQISKNTYGLVDLEFVLENFKYL